MSRRLIFALLAFVLVGAAAATYFSKRRSYVHKPFVMDSSAADAFRAASAAPSSSAPRVWPNPFSVELKGLPPRDALRPGTLRILVIGDSVAKFLGLAMRYRQDERKAFVAERGVGNCSIFATTPYVENGKTLLSSSCSMNWAADVAELHPDMTLVVMGGGFFSSDACKAKFQTEYEARVFELAQAMGRNAGQLVLTRVPYPVKDWRHSNVVERVGCFNEMLVRIAKKGRWPIIDLMNYVCPTLACNIMSEGKPIRPDGLHFDGGGAEDTARWVLDELWRIRKTSPPE